MKISPKRINFVSIQNSQTTHCVGMTPMPCRTGYERVLAHRTEDLYAKTAAQDGTVTSLTNKALLVTYKDGSTASYEIGRRFGKKSGETIPHDLRTTLKAGDSFKQGALLCYNAMYFSVDKLVPGAPVFKAGVLAKVALLESTDTLEDSSAITPAFAARLATISTHTRSIRVRFDQEVRNLIKVGDELEGDSILCTIHAVNAGNSNLFDEKSLDTLRLLSQLTPRAKHAGRVERIEVVYCGDVEHMSKTLGGLAERSNEDLRRLNRQLKRPAVDGEVSQGFRVDGVPMDEDTAVIRVYLTGPTEMGVGDKLVFGNQMKSIVARVLTGKQETESGTQIDAFFAYQSIANRIVLSAEITGTTNTLMRRLGAMALKVYGL